MHQHKNNEKMVMSGVYLPNEIIFEILSHLPIKSLLRFQCVCKIWCSTIKDPVFIIKHMEQAQYEMLYAENQDAEFLCLETDTGVTLEKHRFNGTCRLWNPATRQILYLPPSTEKRKGECTSMCYIRPTNQLKVVYMNSSKRGNKEALIYNVLRVGPLSTWKRLDSPLLLNFRNVQSSAQVTPQGIRLVIVQPIVWPSTLVIGSVFYNIRSAHGLYMDCLDLENDSITSIKVPQCLFNEWKDVWAVDCKGKLALARVEQGRLYICVLENYKNHKWADSKIVVPLGFFINYLSPRRSIKSLVPYLVEGNIVYWRTKGYYQLLSFDAESNEIKYLTPPSTKRNIVCMYRPSLLSIHFKKKHPQRKIEIRQIEETETSLLFKFLRVFRFCLLGA